MVIISATIGDEKLSIKYDKLQQRVTFLSSTQTYSQLVTNNCLVMEVKYMGQIKTINTYKDETQGLFKTNFWIMIVGNPTTIYLQLISNQWVLNKFSLLLMN